MSVSFHKLEFGFPFRASWVLGALRSSARLHMAGLLHCRIRIELHFAMFMLSGVPAEHAAIILYLCRMVDIG